MDKKQRSNLVLGLILVIVGGVYIAANFIPAFRDFLYQANSWPMIIEAAAAGLLVLGLIIGVPDLAVPAVIVAGIGGILWWQNLTGNWGSWVYMWALIPGFSGLGMLLAKVLGGRDRYSTRHALNAIMTSFIMFVIFGAIFGGFAWMGPYWPVLLIAAGLLVGLRSLIRSHSSQF